MLTVNSRKRDFNNLCLSDDATCGPPSLGPIAKRMCYVTGDQAGTVINASPSPTPSPIFNSGSEINMVTGSCISKSVGTSSLSGRGAPRGGPPPSRMRSLYASLVPADSVEIIVPGSSDRSVCSLIDSLREHFMNDPSPLGVWATVATHTIGAHAAAVAHGCDDDRYSQQPPSFVLCPPPGMTVGAMVAHLTTLGTALLWAGAGALSPAPSSKPGDDYTRMDLGDHDARWLDALLDSDGPSTPTQVFIPLCPSASPPTAYDGRTRWIPSSHGHHGHGRTISPTTGHSVTMSPTAAGTVLRVGVQQVISAGTRRAADLAFGLDPLSACHDGAASAEPAVTVSGPSHLMWWAALWLRLPAANRVDRFVGVFEHVFTQ